jgi:hypothetical protein
MSVRMALAKLATFAAGGALLGGGAVHVAEQPARTVQYVKHAKRVCANGGSGPNCRIQQRRPAVRRVATAPRQVKRARRIVKRTVTYPAPVPQVAMAPMPAPYMPPLPPMPVSSSGGKGGI